MLLLISTMYIAYANADIITSIIPFMDTAASLPPVSYKRTIPASETAIQSNVPNEALSLKKMAIMAATITGYTKRSVDATPESIYL